MIRFTDATILALTKLRTHKVRTSITIIISSLLFGLLIAALLVTDGAFQSVSDFSEEGYGSRFLVGASYINYNNFELLQDSSVIARAKEIYKETIAAKKAAAKTLGITYDESSEMQPTTSYTDKAEDTYLTLSSPSAIQAIEEYNKSQPKADLNSLEKIASSYSPTAFYTAETKTPKSGAILLMKDGKEDFSAKNKNSDANTDYMSIETLLAQGSGFTVVDTGLTNTFLLPKEKVKSSSLNVIPVIITYHAAEEILNLPTIKNATPSEQLSRIKEIQSKAGSISFSVCYRNSTSQQQIDEAIAVALEIEKNKNNKDYQKPSVIYQLPADDACSAAAIKSDTRTTEQKNLDAKTKQFNKQFGVETDPDQQKIEFAVIGLMPNMPDYNQSFTAASLLQSLVGSSSNYGIAVPNNLYNGLPDINRYNEIFSKANNIMSSSDNYGVEFNTAKDASNFISQQNCNDIEKCETDGKPFSLYAYGSNSIALDSIKSGFLNIFRIAMLVVVGIAAIIMSGTLGRMVSDSRRETAVFRAIGFKRIDIASIYLTYILILSIFIAISSFAIGSIAAYILDQFYWQDFTIQALLAFGASDVTRQFHFFKLDYIKMSWVLLAILSSGIISTILPLMRNIRRNPIKDMRDE